MKYLKLLPAVAGALLLASCEIEEQIEPAEEAYTKAFIKEFGLIDPKQDWNMATRGSVTVSTPSATEVHVYGKTGDNKYRLVGDFGNVSGSQTLSFDIPRGVTDIIAEANGKAVFTTLGGSADFSNTRTATTRTVTLPEENSDITVSVSDTYKDISADVVESYNSIVPEEGKNLKKVTQNFCFVSDGTPFTIYPIYWNSSSYAYLGIYWYDTDGNVQEQDIYYNKRGSELLCKSQSGTETEYFPSTYEDSQKLKVGETILINENTTDKNKSSYSVLTKIEEAEYSSADATTPSLGTSITIDGKTYYISRIEDNKYYYNKYFYESNWVNPTSDKSSVNQDIKSKGISITLKEGTKFGLYIKVFYEGQYGDNDNKDENGKYRNDWFTVKRYSEAEMNKAIAGKYSYTDKNNHFGSIGYSGQTEYYWASSSHTKNAENSSSDDLEAYAFASYFKTTGNDGKTRYFLGFEDWSYGQTDLNDVIFMFDEEQPTPTVIDEDVTSYILAAEDLGNTDDFDFNDMVIEVTEPKLKSGSTDTYEVKVTALAAGGTLPLKLCRKVGTDDKVLTSPVENVSDDVDKEQFHSWFGDGTVSTGTMINTTSAYSYGTSTMTIEMTEEEKNNFTLSSESVNSKDVTNKMGGFYYKVLRNGNYDMEIKAPEDGAAPQMICVPSTWLWPTERTNISEAYTEFGKWGASYGTSPDWYKTPTGSVVTRTVSE